MKTILRLIALLVAVACIGFWASAGANRGWTKTQVAEKTLDEITGIEGITYKNQFVPGVDFLGGTLLFAAVLAGVSFLIRTKSEATMNRS